MKVASRSPLLAVLAWGGALLLLVLHLDFWREDRARIFFGWLPEELAYRLAWMLLGWIYLLWFCARVWREEDQGER